MASLLSAAAGGSAGRADSFRCCQVLGLNNSSGLRHLISGHSATRNAVLVDSAGSE